MNFRRIFDRYALIISMIIGAVGYPIFHRLGACMPPLIFMMLFFTFCKVNPLALRLRIWHWVVLATQIVLTIVVYYGLLHLLQTNAEVWKLHQIDIDIISQGELRLSSELTVKRFTRLPVVLKSHLIQF